MNNIIGSSFLPKPKTFIEKNDENGPVGCDKPVILTETHFGLGSIFNSISKFFLGTSRNLEQRKISKNSQTIENALFTIIDHPPYTRMLYMNNWKPSFPKCIDVQKWESSVSKQLLRAYRKNQLDSKLIKAMVQHIRDVYQIDRLDESTLPDAQYMLLKALERFENKKNLKILQKSIHRFSGNQDKQLNLIHSSIFQPYQLLDSSCFGTSILFVLHNNYPGPWVSFVADIMDKNEANFNYFTNGYAENFQDKNLIVDVSKYGYKDEGKPDQFYQKAVSAIISLSIAQNAELRQKMENRIKYMLYHWFCTCKFLPISLCVYSSINLVKNAITDLCNIPDIGSLDTKDLISTNESQMDDDKNFPGLREKIMIDLVARKLSKDIEWNHGIYIPARKNHGDINDYKQRERDLEEKIRNIFLPTSDERQILERAVANLDTKLTELTQEISNLKKKEEELDRKIETQNTEQISRERLLKIAELQSQKINIIRSIQDKEDLEEKLKKELLHDKETLLILDTFSKSLKEREIEEGKLERWVSQAAKIVSSTFVEDGGYPHEIIKKIWGEEKAQNLFALNNSFAENAILSIEDFKKLLQNFIQTENSIMPISFDSSNVGHCATAISVNPDVVDKLKIGQRLRIGMTNWRPYWVIYRPQCIYAVKKDNQSIQLCYENNVPIDRDYFGYDGPLTSIQIHPNLRQIGPKKDKDGTIQTESEETTKQK